jgi:glycosyltransferase involved in cell wall biosynthesis
MKNNPLVSIITPSFNQGIYIEDTIMSVLNQTYKNIEYIMIDGGSEDNTLQIIKKYEKGIDYWISEKDAGQADAINKGMKKAKGDLLCWINSDDILYEDFVSTRVKQFLQNPEIDFIYGDVEQGVDISKKRLRKGKPPYNRWNMLKDLNAAAPQQSAMWRREVLEEVGMLDAQWHVLLDRDFFVRIIHKCRIKYFPGAVAFFRNHDKSKSIAEAAKWMEELPIYYENIENVTGPIDHKLKKKILTNTYLECAKIAQQLKNDIAKNNFLHKAKKQNYWFYCKQRYFKKWWIRMNKYLLSSKTLLKKMN